MVNELNHLAITYGPALLASGVLSPLITAVIRLISRYKWTSNDLFRAILAFTIFSLAAGIHMLLTLHFVNRHLMLAQGGLMFLLAQPFFYLFVRPAFKQVDEIVSKSALYDAQAQAKQGQLATAGLTASVATVSPSSTDFSH